MPYLDVDGQKIYFEQLGAGPPLVLLHGIFIDSSVYRPLARRLGEHFRVTLMDTPGHGNSGKLTGHYDLDTISLTLAGAVQQLGLTRPMLIGHSLGGLLALKMAEQVQPKQLVLLDPAGAALNISRIVMTWRMVCKIAVNLTINPLQMIRMLVHSSRTILRNLHPRFWHLIKDNLYRDHLQESAVPACPVTLIWGDKDEVIPVGLIDQYRKRLPKAEVVMVHAGHDWPILQPQLVEWEKVLHIEQSAS